MDESRQVAEGLIYGQVKKCSQRRKLIRVTYVMRLGTADADPRRLTGIGPLWEVEHGFHRAGSTDHPPWKSGAGSSHLGDGATVLMPARPSGVVAS